MKKKKQKKTNRSGKKTISARGIALLCLLIVVVTWISYFPSLSNEFTNWDDPVYVTDNKMITDLSGTNLKELCSEPVSLNYHPFTMLSLALNYKMSGNNPYSYHLTNLIFHLFNTLLVFFLVFLMTGKNRFISFAVSLLFGIHPMHVESVAWISERKDVLYTFFYLLSLIFYIRYIHTEKRKFIVLTFFLFLFSLLCKAMAVTLPIILLLADYFFHRKGTKTVWMEKIPFFALSLFFGALAYVIQSKEAIAGMDTFSFIQRILFASYGLVMYFVKLVLPLNLSALYSYPTLDNRGYLPLIYYLSPFLVLSLCAAVYIFFRKNRFVIFGLLFFFFNIALVLQFISVGHAVMADRYTYVSYIGLFFIAGYAGHELTLKKNILLSYLLFTLLLLYLIFLAYLTHERCKIWKNNDVLWTNVLKQYPYEKTGYKNRGSHFRKLNSMEKALSDYAVFEKLGGVDAAVYRDMANIYGLKNEYKISMNYYSKALAIDSLSYNAYFNRAITYAMMKEYEKSLADYNKAITLDPSSTETYANRAYLYMETGNYDKAIADYDFLIAKNTGDANLYFQRAMVKFKSDLWKEAFDDYKKCTELEPDNRNAFYNLSVCCYKLSDYPQALKFALTSQKLGFQPDPTYIINLQKLARNK